MRRRPVVGDGLARDAELRASVAIEGCSPAARSYGKKHAARMNPPFFSRHRKLPIDYTDALRLAQAFDAGRRYTGEHHKTEVGRVECRDRNGKWMCDLPAEHVGPHEANGIGKVLAQWSS